MGSFLFSTAAPFEMVARPVAWSHVTVPVPVGHLDVRWSDGTCVSGRRPVLRWSFLEMPCSCRRCSSCSAVFSSLVRGVDSDLPTALSFVLSLFHDDSSRSSHCNSLQLSRPDGGRRTLPCGERERASALDRRLAKRCSLS